MKKLPTLQLPIHNIELPYSKQKLKIKPFIIKEELSLLTMLSTDNNEDIVSAFSSLIENCVLDENFSINDLCFIDFCYLLLFIRMKSSGEMLDLRQNCSSCGKNNDFQINLEDSIKFENLETKKLKCKLDNELMLEIVPAKIKTLLEIEKIKDTKQQMFYVIGSIISKVIFKETIYTEFTIEELIENIVSNLTRKQMDLINKEIQKLPQMFIEYKFICLNCNTENIRKISNIKEFF